MHEYLKRLLEERVRVWEGTKALLDSAAAEKRNLSAEEDAEFARRNADLDALDARIKDLSETLERAKQAEETRGQLATLTAPSETRTLAVAADPVMEGVRSFLRGERRSLEIRPDGPVRVNELRTLSRLTAGAGGNTVQTSFYNRLFAHLIEVNALINGGATVLTTDSGENLQIPKTTAHSTAALTAETAVISASDPAFGLATLGAYKYAVLMQVSNEMATDTSIDLEGYLAMNAGRAVGNAGGAHFVTGTGTAQPAGIITGATVGVTGGTAVVGAFTADNLIDLYYSVINPYRNSPAAAWLMKDSTLGAVRKLKDTTNQYLWQPSMQVGAPDTLLGKPVYTDPTVAAPALNAKSVLFGDLSQYVIRQVAGVRFERSDDFAFSSDLITFRCIWRADGVLVDQTGAVKVFVGGAS